MSDSNSTITFGVGILVGALVGAIVATLFIMVVQGNTFNLSANINPAYVPLTKSLRDNKNG